MLTVSGPVTVRVPATSANLGPGFDSFGLALGLYDEVEVTALDSGLLVEVKGEGAGSVPRDASHLVVRAMALAFGRLGLELPALLIRCRNSIPHGRGLGSSAAAVVAGILAARALVVDGDRRLPDDDVLALASSMEGHPDNVAACLHGGFTIAWIDESGRPGAHRLAVDPAIRPVVCIPATELATLTARTLLPEQVTHAVAAANSARAGLLVAALTGAPDLLMRATEDRLHQEFRRRAMPESLALIDHLRAAGVAAVVSGAGPSVLALCLPGQVELVEQGAGGFVVRELPVDSDGASLR